MPQSQRKQYADTYANQKEDALMDVTIGNSLEPYVASEPQKMGPGLWCLVVLLHNVVSLGSQIGIYGCVHLHST